MNHVHDHAAMVPTATTISMDHAHHMMSNITKMTSGHGVGDMMMTMAVSE